jgi:hypothetical protein
VLADGRELSAPIDWFPRLRDATPDQRGDWRLIGGGEGIHWPDIDEDIAVSTLLDRGEPSEPALSRDSTRARPRILTFNLLRS